MLGQRPANQPPCLRIPLFDLRGEVVPQLPRHDPPIVGGDCRRETADRQPNECFPEKTLWPLRSLPPHTLGIRDNGRVNEADQHTTETLDERPTRGNRLYPRVTSFRSRRGSLTDPQQQCWDRRWPELGKEVGDEPLDVDAWFGRSAPLVLEIGSGTGTAAVAMAQAEPEVNLIAVEVYKPGIARHCRTSNAATTPTRRSGTCGSCAATPSRCSRRCSPPSRSPACGSSSRIRGPRPATTSAGSCRPRRSP